MSERHRIASMDSIDDDDDDSGPSTVWPSFEPFTNKALAEQSVHGRLPAPTPGNAALHGCANDAATRREDAEAAARRSRGSRHQLRAHFTPVALRAFRLLDRDGDGILCYQELRVFATFFGHADRIDDFCVELWKDLGIDGLGLTLVQWLRLVAGAASATSLARPVDAAGLLQMIAEFDELCEREASANSKSQFLER